MKTIHKLVLKSYLGPMVLTFFIVMFVLMMNIVWRYIDELVGKGLSAGIIIELMTYFMANLIPMGLPLSMLLAAIMTMGNLGENYELLAMKSAGMSLVKITKPLIILVSVLAVASFFIGNNLVPTANKKLYSTLYDIRQQKQALEFQDGLFFNGIDNMSIRVSHQEPDTHLLHNVLIYDNRDASGNMNTIVADSGYIRLSDDKRFLLVTLFHGETYEQTRNSQWFNQSSLRHHIFDLEKQVIPMEGFAMERTDANLFSNSSTKNINELQHDIDSLEIRVNTATTSSYSRSRSSPATRACCLCRTACAWTRAGSGTWPSPIRSLRFRSATARRCGTRHGAWPRTRATCSRSTNRTPRKHSTSSTARRSNGTRRSRSRCRSSSSS